MTVGFTQGHRVVGSAKLVGWDRWRFAAPAHHDFSMFFNGGPALEASWSHPTLKKAMALGFTASGFATARLSSKLRPVEEP